MTREHGAELSGNFENHAFTKATAGRVMFRHQMQPLCHYVVVASNNIKCTAQGSCASVEYF
jgi:hypothetical protein